MRFEYIKTVDTDSLFDYIPVACGLDTQFLYSSAQKINVENL